MSAESQFDYMDAVDKALTETVLLRVRKFAEGRVAVLHAYALAGDAREMVHDAVQDTFTGQRLWNPDACELHVHLSGIIRSRVSHELRDRTTSRDFPIGVRENAQGDDPVDVLVTFGTEQPRSPEQRMIDRDLADKVVAEIVAVAKVKNDNQVRAMVELWRDGVTDRGDVAERLGISRKHTANARERLLRFAAKLPEPLRAGSPSYD